MRSLSCSGGAAESMAGSPPPKARSRDLRSRNRVAVRRALDRQPLGGPEAACQPATELAPQQPRTPAEGAVTRGLTIGSLSCRTAIELDFPRFHMVLLRSPACVSDQHASMPM